MSAVETAVSNAIAQSLLEEFEAQAPITRRFLERLPAAKLTWKPHQKSMTAGQLAYHLATTPGGVVQAAKINPAPLPDFNHFPQPASLEEVLALFEQNVATVRSLLPQFDDEAMRAIWRVESAGREIFALPRSKFLRDILLSHWYQHRGQFSVYLRLLDVPVPASWGPSADEQPPFMS